MLLRTRTNQAWYSSREYRASSLIVMSNGCHLWDRRKPDNYWYRYYDSELNVTHTWAPRHSNTEYYSWMPMTVGNTYKDSK